MTRHLDFDIARKKGAPLGQYIVHVKFNVDTRGRVVDVETENDPGYGMVKEAIRVIKESPRWYPATRNGVPFKAPVKLGISFVVR